MPTPVPGRVSVWGDLRFLDLRVPCPDNLQPSHRPNPPKGACAMGMYPVRPGRKEGCCLQRQIWVWTELGLSPGCHACMKEALKLWMELGWGERRCPGLRKY